MLMRKVLFSLIALILSTSVSFAQYANPGYGDVTKTTEYKIANTAYYGGLVVAGVGTAAWLVGNVICTIELNKYTNSHTTSGTVEEIYSLNQEAKQQPEYKKGEALEIGGYVSMLAGAGIALLGRHKVKKLKNAAGQTAAVLDYGLADNGIVLALNF